MNFWQAFLMALKMYAAKGIERKIMRLSAKKAEIRVVQLALQRKLEEANKAVKDANTNV